MLSNLCSFRNAANVRKPIIAGVPFNTEPISVPVGGVPCVKIVYMGDLNLNDSMDLYGIKYRVCFCKDLALKMEQLDYSEIDAILLYYPQIRRLDMTQFSLAPDTYQFICGWNPVNIVKYHVQDLSGKTKGTWICLKTYNHMCEKIEKQPVDYDPCVSSTNNVEMMEDLELSPDSVTTTTNILESSSIARGRAEKNDRSDSPCRRGRQENALEKSPYGSGCKLRRLMNLQNSPVHLEMLDSPEMSFRIRERLGGVNDPRCAEAARKMKDACSKRTDDDDDSDENIVRDSECDGGGEGSFGRRLRCSRHEGDDVKEGNDDNGAKSMAVLALERLEKKTKKRIVALEIVENASSGNSDYGGVAEMKSCTMTTTMIIDEPSEAVEDATIEISGKDEQVTEGVPVLEKWPKKRTGLERFKIMARISAWGSLEGDTLAPFDVGDESKTFEMAGVTRMYCEGEECANRGGCTDWKRIEWHYKQGPDGFDKGCVPIAYCSICINDNKMANKMKFHFGFRVLLEASGVFKEVTISEENAEHFFGISNGYPISGLKIKPVNFVNNYGKCNPQTYERKARKSGPMAIASQKSMENSLREEMGWLWKNRELRCWEIKKMKGKGNYALVNTELASMVGPRGSE